jgi:predicted transcriptional regulator
MYPHDSIAKLGRAASNLSGILRTLEGYGLVKLHRQAEPCASRA